MSGHIDYQRRLGYHIGLTSG